MLPPRTVTPPPVKVDYVKHYLLIFHTNKPIIAAKAGVKIPVPATREAAIRVDPPVTTSIALTETVKTVQNQKLFDSNKPYLLCNYLCN